MRHYQEPLQKAAADIAEAVFPFDYRGMRVAMRRVPADAYLRAARALLKQDPGVAVLTTGFPVGGTAETDGPPGAARHDQPEPAGRIQMESQRSC